MPEKQDPLLWHQCPRCTRISKNDSIKPLHAIKDLAARLEPGKPTPSGECLACGSLTYPKEMLSNAFYIKVRVEVNYLKPKNWNDIVEEVSTNMDYYVKYKAPGISIKSTEIISVENYR